MVCWIEIGKRGANSRFAHSMISIKLKYQKGRKKRILKCVRANGPRRLIDLNSNVPFLCLCVVDMRDTHTHSVNEFTNDNMESVRKDMLTKGLRKKTHSRIPTMKTATKWWNDRQNRLERTKRMNEGKTTTVCEGKTTNERYASVYYNSKPVHEWRNWHELGKYHFYWYSRWDLITCTSNEWHVYCLTASTCSNYRTNRTHTRNTLKIIIIVSLALLIIILWDHFLASNIRSIHL